MMPSNGLGVVQCKLVTAVNKRAFLESSRDQEVLLLSIFYKVGVKNFCFNFAEDLQRGLWLRFQVLELGF